MRLVDVQTQVGATWDAQFSADLPALEALMVGAGVEDYVVSSWAALAAGEVWTGNAALVQAVKHRTRGHVWLSLNPMFWQESQRVLVELGADPSVVGVRLHPVVGRYTLDEFSCGRLLSAIEESGLPVLVHVENGGGSAGSRAVRATAERYPGVPFIAAHLGVSENFHSGIDAVVGCRTGNLYLETSGLELLYTRYLEFVVRNAGAERVLFGSNAPVFAPAVMSHMLELAELEADALSLVAYENADRILFARAPSDATKGGRA